MNGDDPEAVVRVAQLAFDFRQQFKRDVVVDIVCYRRYGHNETDDPSYTQPLLYQKIKEHTSVARLYGAQLVREGVLSAAELEGTWNAAKQVLDSAYEESEGGGRAYAVDSLIAPPA